jgi:hypothetical protein
VPRHYTSQHWLIVIAKSDRDREEVRRNVFYTSYSHGEKGGCSEALNRKSIEGGVEKKCQK